MLKATGFIVVEAIAISREHQFDTIEEAQEEAARVYAHTKGVSRIMILTPVAVIQPKLGPETELKFTEIGKPLQLAKPKEDPQEQG